MSGGSLPQAKWVLKPISDPSIVPLENWPGYGVDRSGNAWSRYVLFSHRIGDQWRMLNPSVNTWGHRQVSMTKNGKVYRPFVHRLILEAFVGPCPPGMEARHLDDNKANNRLENLCWGTPSENYADRVANGIGNQGARNGRARLTDDHVREIRRLYSNGHGSGELSRKFGVSSGAIWRIAQRKAWRHVV